MKKRIGRLLEFSAIVGLTLVVLYLALALDEIKNETSELRVRYSLLAARVLELEDAVGMEEEIMSVEDLYDMLQKADKEDGM